jgi:hypothetical protein
MSEMVENMTYAALVDFRIEELKAENSRLGELIAAKTTAGIETKNLSEVFAAQLEKLIFLKAVWGQMFDGLRAGDIIKTMEMSLPLGASIAGVNNKVPAAKPIFEWPYTE